MGRVDSVLLRIQNTVDLDPDGHLIDARISLRPVRNGAAARPGRPGAAAGAAAPAAAKLAAKRPTPAPLQLRSN